MSRRETSSTEGSRAGRVLTPGRIAIGILVILLLVFIFENTSKVRIRLLIPEVTMPLYLALLVTALLSAVCGYFAAARRRK
ncbi:LapA family protein [Streptomyces roseicoloratus]|uniref:LapA family protein n=1 Tax=Streptomyces roseicoloratus TaxID=2508722 RepID=A0ABY9RPV3_9ACTN|nr:LapA family protein [Streptomyces roseicoloratus]WMX44223.1 LapA family protein [Streptomyces roseicoloratus]